MNKMDHPQSDTDRLYIPRMEGGRGLLTIEGCVKSFSIFRSVGRKIIETF